jgi:hypothetical protein
MRQNQKFIEDIICDGIKYIGEVKAIIAIRKFYQNLYSKKETSQNSSEMEDFFRLCPKLTEVHRHELDKPLTLEELSSALSSCKQSSPGPDGISYAIYKAYWKILAPYILNAWLYSIEIGEQSNSNLESVITLLPKQDKDTSDIKNWRPITLSNCDSKIITKAISIRVAKVLDTIIYKTQTAYVPSRSVMDNIRSNYIIKDICSKKDLDAVLISLDAKKAFDSVSHEYIYNVLKHYGFGEYFINNFRVLYANLSSTIMINGHKSEKINIRRGVKQGDALSCSLFILCIDPLIRNIKANNRIKGIDLKSRKYYMKDTYKVSGYADDIAIICKSDIESVNEVFYEYERLTKLSGLELNADKTEILILNNQPLQNAYHISYLNDNYVLYPVSNIKICGLFYSKDENVEYKHNVLDKISKLEGQLKKWTIRNLSFEGKVLIVKTFGLSQLIYNMQCYEIKMEELIKIERLIFKFIWSKKWSTNRPVERIRRTFLKNAYEEGGVNAPDVECLDRALKLKQFLRSDNSNHPIKELQKILVK